LRTPRTFHHLGSVAALSALVLTLVATPTAAAGKTRVVDDDGKGTAASCDAKTSALKSIQKAVDASGPGDIVKVCPGTYPGRVKISGARTGLRLLSTTPRGATIKDPDSYLPVMPPLVLIDGVADVVVKGFKVRTLSTGAYLPSQMDGITANNAKNVTISGNNVSWSGAPGEISELLTGITAKGGTTGIIKGNTIKDPRVDGIFVTDAGTDVTVQGNTIDAEFAGDAAIEGDDGIEVSTGAKALVKANTIIAANGSSAIITKLSSGVRLYNASAATVVRDNTITRPIVGIETYGNGYDLLDNGVLGRQIGISLVSSDNLTVTGNTSKATAGSGYGISALEASDGSTISGNDVRGSSGADCFEDDGNNDGIDNTWQDNQFNDATPSGLCAQDTVPR